MINILEYSSLLLIRFLLHPLLFTLFKQFKFTITCMFRFTIIYIYVTLLCCSLISSRLVSSSGCWISVSAR